MAAGGSWLNVAVVLHSEGFIQSPRGSEGGLLRPREGFQGPHEASSRIRVHTCERRCTENPEEDLQQITN